MAKEVNKFKLLPLKEVYALSKEKLDEKLAPARTKQSKIRLELKMAELEEKISSTQSAVQDVLLKKDLDFDKLADLLDDISILELRLNNFSEMMEQLFPQ
jgi:hypothetical protein